jgi:cell division inhibitor SulA
MGIGEIRLMLPYLKAKQENGLLVFVAPPAMLDAEFFVSNGIHLNNVLVITEYDLERTLWVTEQCLKSGSCGAVLLWQKNLSVKQSRRLMLASEQGDSVLLLYRLMSQQEKSERAFSVPSNVSMTLTAAAEGLMVNIDKQRGGRSFKNLSVDMRERWPDLTMLPVSNENVVAFPKVIAH